jgi:Family of unknown function (DUF5675)
MKATYKRTFFSTTITTGFFTLYGDDGAVLFQCFQLEPVARAAGVKIKGHTAIPAGNYRIRITQSQRFGRLMPLIYSENDWTIKDSHGNVWTGVRQHTGNTEHDTEACQLMGRTRSNEGVFESRLAFEEYFPILHDKIGTVGQIDYEIINDQQP